MFDLLKKGIRFFIQSSAAGLYFGVQVRDDIIPRNAGVIEYRDDVDEAAVDEFFPQG